MPESGREFVAAWRANARRLAAAGLYNPADEHDSCGVGFVAAVDGKPRRSIVEAGINALKAVWHRGAVSADGKTGDGAGIHVQIPQDFFKQHIARTGHEPREGPLAVGMVFLPKTDLAAQETCRAIVESEILRFGYNIYGWRQVPVDSSVIGETANATRPEVEQIMIDNRKGGRDEKFERDLYIIRRRIEKAVLDQHIGDFYICSLSCHSLIYKGMFLAEVPADENECRQMLYTGIQVDGPASVRYPRGGGPGVEVEKEMTALPIAKAEIRSQGKRIAILAFGVVLEFAQAAADELGATVVNMRFVKPIDEELILKMAATHDLIVTVEENVVQGGAGEAVNQVLVENGVVQAIVNYGLPDRLIQHGSRDDMLDDVGMNKEGLMQFIRHHLGEHEQSAKIKSV